MSLVDKLEGVHIGDILYLASSTKIFSFFVYSLKLIRNL